MSMSIRPASAGSTARGRRTRLAAAFAFVAVAALAGGFLTVPSAHADTAPLDPRDPGTPQTVSADVLPTPQLGTGASQARGDVEGTGTVWDQIVIGNTVYVGGNFLHARPYGAAANQGVVDRGNLLAYDIRSGELLPFAPSFNQAIQSLAVSPDNKTLYVAGSFSAVDGKAAYRVAAFDVATGTRIATFKPSINATVSALIVTDTTVYMSGTFSTVNGVARAGLAAVDRKGALTAWAPQVARSSVQAMQLSPSGDRILLGGNFLTVNGSSNPGHGMGIVRSDTGTSLQDDGKPFSWSVNGLIRNGVSSGQFVTTIQSFASDGKSVYGTAVGAADGGSFEGVFKVDWADGAIQWIADCHGDTYSVALHGGSAYFAGHTHDCIGMGEFGEYVGADGWYRGLAVSQATTGTLKPWTDVKRYRNYGGQPAPTLQHWFPSFNTGLFTGANQGPWDVTASGDYVLFGGEFTTVNGSRQRGLARFAVRDVAKNTQGPQLSGADMKPPFVQTFDGTGVRIQWPANYDRDNARLTYELYRDGKTDPVFTTTAASSFYERPTIRGIDTGLTAGTTYSYRVRTVDPTGRETWGDPVSYTAGPYTAYAGAMSGYDKAVLEDQPSAYWPLNDTNVLNCAFDWAGARSNNIVPIFSHVPGIAGGTSLPVDGKTNNVWSQSPVTPPKNFSMELWVKTTSTQGGLLMGFSNTTGPGAPKGSAPTDAHDRQIYMGDTGRLYFEVFDSTNGTMHTVSTPASYNDGAWHHVVTTVSDDRTRIFVDGVERGSGPMTGTIWTFPGYWGIGGHDMYGRVDRPTSNFIAASIDNVATYDRVVTASEVTRHHSIGAVANVAPTAAFAAKATGLTVTVDGSTSTDTDGRISSYSWNFGDQTSASGTTATKTYAKPGTYTLSLTVTDDRGARNAVTRQVTVEAATTETAADDFERTVAPGWGSAPTGGAWTLNAAKDFGVSGGGGTITAAAGQNRTATLPAVSTSRSDTTATFTVGAAATGGGQNLWVTGRQVGSDSYAARVQLTASGKVTLTVLRSNTAIKAVALPGTYSVGDPITIRLQVVGTGVTSLTASAWTGPAPEKPTWLIKVEDSTAALQQAGSVGIGTYTSGSGTPTTVRVDGFRSAPIG